MTFSLTLGQLVLVSTLYLLVNPSDGKSCGGRINTTNNFVFLGKFAFGTNRPKLEYDIFYPANSTAYSLVIFDDTIGQWGTVRHHGNVLSCSQKVNRIEEPKFKISLTAVEDGCDVSEDKRWLCCKGKVNFPLAKSPRRYFFHLTNCKGRGSRGGILGVKFNLHMTNGQGHLDSEFSFDRRFILETDFGFLVAYLGVFVIGTANYKTLKRKRDAHFTYGLFYMSLVLQVACLVLHCLALCWFSLNGLGLPWVDYTADILYCFSSGIMVTVLLFVSKGLSMTRPRLSVYGSFKLAIFAFAYTTAYLLFYVYYTILADPRDIGQLYSTKAASGLMACRITGLIWLVYNVFFTLKIHHNKRMFYVVFLAFFTVWFLVEPVTIYLAACYMPSMDSFIIHNGLQWLIAICGHVFFLALTRPSTLHTSFPFHQQVNKVGQSYALTASIEPHRFPASNEIFLVDHSLSAILNRTPKSEDIHDGLAFPSASYSTCHQRPAADVQQSHPIKLNLSASKPAWPERKTPDKTPAVNDVKTFARRARRKLSFKNSAVPYVTNGFAAL